MPRLHAISLKLHDMRGQDVEWVAAEPQEPREATRVNGD